MEALIGTLVIFSLSGHHHLRVTIKRADQKIGVGLYMGSKRSEMFISVGLLTTLSELKHQWKISAHVRVRPHPSPTPPPPSKQMSSTGLVPGHNCSF